MARIGFCLTRSRKHIVPSEPLIRVLLWGCTGTSMPAQSSFWEAIFLPQLDFSSLSKCQLAPSGPKHPVAAAREKGKGAQGHGRDRHSPPGVSAGPGQRNVPDPALEHPLPQHPASRSGERTPGARMREAGPEMSRGKPRPFPPPAAPRARAPLPEQDARDEAAAAGAAPGHSSDAGGSGPCRHSDSPSRVPASLLVPQGRDPARPTASAHRGQAPLPAPGDILQESSTNMSQTDLGTVARQMNLCRNVAFVIKPPVYSV